MMFSVLARAIISRTVKSFRSACSRWSNAVAIHTSSATLRTILRGTSRWARVEFMFPYLLVNRVNVNGGGFVPGGGRARPPPSVLRHARIHPVAPGEYAALHIAHVLEARRLQDAAGSRAPHPALAVNHDVGVGIEFAQPLADLAERNQPGRRDVADLVFVGLAHVDQHKGVAD